MNKNFRSTSQISKVFINIVTILSIFGTCPIISNVESNWHVFQYFPNRWFPSRVLSSQNKKRAERSFQIGFTTWNKYITWHSYLVLSLSLFCYITYLVNIGLGSPYPIDAIRFKTSMDNESYGLNTQANDNIIVGLAVGYIILHLNMFASSALLVKWLNNWDDFEENFRGHFISKGVICRFNIAKTQRIFLFGYTLPLILLSFLQEQAFFHYIYEYNQKYSIIANLMILWYFTMLMFYPFLEDYKTFLMLRTFKISIAQLREAIQMSTQLQMASQSDIKIWRKLLQQIRKQMQLGSESIKGRQLILLVQVVFVVSCGLALSLDLVSKGKSIFAQNFYFIGTCFYCFTYLLRLYITVFLAEDIYKEEKRLAQDIVKIRDGKIDKGTKSEAAFLHNIITLQPSVITIGRYVELDKKLLIDVAAQTLTLFIAMMQANSGVDKKQ